MKRLLLAALLVAPASFGLDVTGAVFGADGKPIAGARVTAHLPEPSVAREARLVKREQRPAIATTETDAEGAFSFEKLPDTVVDLAISATEFAPQVLRTFPGDIPLTSILQRAELKRGRVTSSGKPVEGALVVWVGANGAEHMATTDASGHYEVPFPSVWAHEPTVLHPKLGTKIGSSRGGERLDFELAATSDRVPPKGSRTLEGTVTLDGKPFAGAPVVIQPHSESYAGAIRVVADAKGVFRATNLLPLRHSVWSGEGLDPRVRPHFQSTGIEPEAFNTVDLRTDEKAVIALKLQRAPMITGRVLDHESKPVAGAQIQIIPSGQSAIAFMSDLGGRTDADGRYTLAAPYFEPDMRAEVVVMPRASSAVRSDPFTLTANRVVDIRLPRYEPIVVRVVDERGESIPNALVAFLSSDEESQLRDISMLVRAPFVSRAIRTADDGTTLLHLEPGSYDFAATAEGFQTLGVTERPVRRSSEITLQLEREQLLRGRVHREGVGVAAARVAIVGGEMPRAETGATTDANGSFELRGLARGRYRVMIFKAEELISRTIEVEAPGTIDLALPPAGTLTVEVLDATTGDAIRDFAWSLEPLGEPESDVRMRGPGRPTEHRAGGGSSTGAVTVRASAGSYRLTVGATGFAASESQEVVLRAAEETRIAIRLSRGAGLTGRVLDESGLPVHEAAVFAFGAEEQERSRVRVRPSNAQSGADGSYTLSGLTPGDITVTVRKEGFVPIRKVLRVDGMTPLDLTLSRGLSIEGVVTKNGKPVAEANVGAMTAAMGGDHQPGTTDRDGRFVIRGLVPGRYTVSVFAENASKEIHDVDPTQQRRLAISLDPEPRGILFGTVRGIPANPEGKITRRVVWVQGRNGGAEGAIDAAGNYRIEDAPTGSVFVTASIETPRSNRTSERVEVTLEAGQPARVDLDLGGAIVVRGRATFEGAPIAGARIVFGMANNTYASTTTSADGVYEMALPAAGVYQINAHSERLRAMHYQTVREIRTDMTIDIDVREHTVEGQIVDAVSRQPVAGAIVTLVPAGGVGEITAGESIADGNGRFMIATAADGRYNVIVTAPGYAHATHPLTLGATAPRLVVELTASEPLRIRLVDARNGTPLEGHLTIATKEGLSLPARGTRSLDGLELRFSLAPGTYRVTAIVQGYGEKTVEVTAPGVAEIGM